MRNGQCLDSLIFFKDPLRIAETTIKNNLIIRQDRNNCFNKTHEINRLFKLPNLYNLIIFCHIHKVTFLAYNFVQKCKNYFTWLISSNAVYLHGNC